MSASAVRPAKSAAPRKRETAPPPSTPAQPSAKVATGFNGNRRVPPPVNEPVKIYAPGSPERAALKARLDEMANERIDIPIIIGGQEIRTGDLAQAVMPHDHQHVLADWHKATAGTRRAGDRRVAQARRRTGRTGRGKIAPRCSSRGGAARHDLAADAQRLDDARPVEDGVPGGDRRGVRADRLLALQSGVRAGAVRRAAAQRPARCGTSSTTARSRDSSTR